MSHLGLSITRTVTMGLRDSLNRKLDVACSLVLRCGSNSDIEGRPAFNKFRQYSSKPLKYRVAECYIVERRIIASLQLYS